MTGWLNSVKVKTEPPPAIAILLLLVTTLLAQDNLFAPPRLYNPISSETPPLEPLHNDYGVFL